MEGKIVRTVCGDIDPDDLGLTDTHEHPIACMDTLVEAVIMYKDAIGEDALEVRPDNMAFLRSGTSLFSDGCSSFNDVEWLKAELGFFRDKVGGGCVVDASPISMRGDTRLLREASRETGVHIVCTTGLYYELGRPAEYRTYSEAQVYDLCMDEVQNGIAGSEDENGVRVYPGFVKCGMSSGGEGTDIPACEIATLKALARIAGETGLSLHVHTGQPMTASQVISVAETALASGCPADRLDMMHLDQYVRVPADIKRFYSDPECGLNVNVDLQKEILSMGCFIGFDGWSNLAPILPTNMERMKALIQLMAGGYGGQIVLGHDIYDKARSCALGGWGYSDFALNLITALYDYDDVIDIDEIDKLMYDNPARLLAFDPEGV